MLPVLIELAGVALVAVGLGLLEPALALVTVGLYLLYTTRDAR